mmetsp:Transcript_11376/g.37605  ORF Transcript_11376/g.37605 Transcript_11376/m.37605 type:complete len:248 (+) Transcript_11376:3677-4420(+)
MALKRSVAKIAAAPAGPACCDSLSLSFIRQKRSKRLMPFSCFDMFSAIDRAFRTPDEEGVFSGTAKSPTSACSQSALLRTIMPTTRSMSSPTPGGKESTSLPSPPKGVLDALPSPASLVPPGKIAPSGGRHHSEVPSMITAQCHSRFPPFGRSSFCVSVTVRVPSAYSMPSMCTVPWVSMRSWPPKSTFAASSKRIFPDGGAATLAFTRTVVRPGRPSLLPPGFATRETAGTNAARAVIEATDIADT